MPFLLRSVALDCAGGITHAISQTSSTELLAHLLLADAHASCSMFHEFVRVLLCYEGVFPGAIPDSGPGYSIGLSRLSAAVASPHRIAARITRDAGDSDGCGTLGLVFRGYAHPSQARDQNCVEDDRIGFLPLVDTWTPWHASPTHFWTRGTWRLQLESSW
jgi:hypothetical protein